MFVIIPIHLAPITKFLGVTRVTNTGEERLNRIINALSATQGLDRPSHAGLVSVHDQLLAQATRTTPPESSISSIMANRHAHFRSMSLPPELRDMVYEHVIATHTIQLHDSGCQVSVLGPRVPALGRANPQIRDEMIRHAARFPPSAEVQVTRHHHSKFQPNITLPPQAATITHLNLTAAWRQPDSGPLSWLMSSLQRLAEGLPEQMGQPLQADVTIVLVMDAVEVDPALDSVRQCLRWNDTLLTPGDVKMRCCPTYLDGGGREMGCLARRWSYTAGALSDEVCWQHLRGILYERTERQLNKVDIHIQINIIKLASDMSRSAHDFPSAVH